MILRFDVSPAGSDYVISREYISELLKTISKIGNSRRGEIRPVNLAFTFT